MRTVDTPTSSGRNWWRKTRTDLALLGRIVRMVISYGTDGRKIRKIYRRAQAGGQFVWVDDLAETERQLK